MVVMEFGTGDVFWSMVWFFLFFIWVMLLFRVFADVFGSDDLSGWEKTIWTVFVIVLPYLGVFVYLIARGRRMAEHSMQAAQRQDEAMREYVRSVATTSSPVEDLARLSELEAQGHITHEEFDRAKAKILG